MGRQSSRIYLLGGDHKEVYYDGCYHKQMYLSDKEGKLTLVWEKLEEAVEEESLYDVYGLVHTQGLYFALVMKKGEFTNMASYANRVFLLVGRSLTSMKIVYYSKYSQYIYTEYLREGQYYMGYTDTEVFILWSDRNKADIYDINENANIQQAIDGFIYIPMAKGDDKSIYPSMGAVTANGGVAKFVNYSSYRVYMYTGNSTALVNTGIRSGSDVRGMVILNDGFIYFPRKTTSTSIDAEITVTYKNEKWSYITSEIPDVFARIDSANAGLIEPVHISSIHAMFIELMSEMVVKIDKYAQSSGNYKPHNVNIRFDTSAPVRTGNNTVFVFLILRAEGSHVSVKESSTGILACNIDFSENVIISKHIVENSSSYAIPLNRMLNAVRVGRNYLFWNTYKFSKADVFRYNVTTQSIEELKIDGVSNNAPLIPCSYENNEIAECMNVTYSNGNANKLFTYNFVDKTTKVKKIAVFVK